MILDEATASVDTMTEAKIQDAMESVTAGRTCLMIAHRLSTVRNADMILVVRQGKIVEQGTHSQLLKKRGYYRELYTRQTKPPPEFWHKTVKQQRSVRCCFFIGCIHFFNLLY